MNKTKIEWCDMTWNPVVGCSLHCHNCYAWTMNERFGWLKDFSKPEFYQERLLEPVRRIKPSIIFVVSMGDIMDDLIPNAVIKRIINSMEMCSQHQFMVLSKHPGRYRDFYFPDNVWLGTSISNSIESYRITNLVQWNTNNRKFVSLEPIKGYSNDLPLEKIDLLIIGAMTGKNPLPVNKKWFNEIEFKNIFYKEELRRQVTGLPKGDKKQIWNFSHQYHELPTVNRKNNSGSL